MNLRPSKDDSGQVGVLGTLGVPFCVGIGLGGAPTNPRMNCASLPIATISEISRSVP